MKKRITSLLALAAFAVLCAACSRTAGEMPAPQGGQIPAAESEENHAGQVASSGPGETENAGGQSLSQGEGTDLEAENGKASSFLAGMILQFMNPKIYIYAITAMSLYILPAFHSAGALIGFTLVLTVIGASGSFVWAVCGSAFCGFFARHTRAVNLIMALLLVYCAVSLFL